MSVEPRYGSSRLACALAATLNVGDGLKPSGCVAAHRLAMLGVRSRAFERAEVREHRGAHRVAQLSGIGYGFAGSGEWLQ